MKMTMTMKITNGLNGGSLFEVDDKKYGAVLDVNVIERIQLEYKAFDKWRFLALGSSAVPSPSEEKIRDQCCFLSRFCTGAHLGEVEKMNVEAATQVVKELKEYARLPITIKKTVDGGAVIAPYDLIIDIGFTNKPIERVETGISARHLLKGTKFMVDEYVRIYNADLYGNPPLPWLTEKQLGELKIADLVDITIETMINSCPQRKNVKEQEPFKFEPVDTSFIYMIAMSKWHFPEESVKRLTPKRFDEFFETYKSIQPQQS